MKNFIEKLARKAHREDGSVTFFILFLFIFLFVFGGMAVDIARLESERVELQNVLDSALFAARVNNDDAYTDDDIMDDFFAKSGVQRGSGENANWGLGQAPWLEEGEITEAWARKDSRNLFLSLYGFEKFNVLALASVEQKYTDIEISLVVDVSSSMEGEKMTDLRKSVGDFAKKMFEIPYVKTHLTIIPFDYQTNAGRNLLTAYHAASAQAVDGVDDDGLRKRTAEDIYNMRSHCINLDRGTYDASESDIIGGDFGVSALTLEMHGAAYTPSTSEDGQSIFVLNDTGDEMANGARAIDMNVGPDGISVTSSGVFRDRYSAWLFDNNDLGATNFNWYSQTFNNVGIGSGYDDANGVGYDNPTCRLTTGSAGGNGDNSILPFATTLDQVTIYMAALQPEGSTAGDLGLKWGVALLDPSMRNTVKAMIDGVGTIVPSESISSDFEGRPANYDDEKTLKVLVHMSDGRNTLYQNLSADFLDTDDVNPSNTSNVFMDTERGTFSVKYTASNGSTRYWCANGSSHYFKNSKTCGQQPTRNKPYGKTNSANNSVELSKREVLNYFTVPDAVNLFFNGGTYSDIDLDVSDIVNGDGGYTSGTWKSDPADARFQTVCDVAASKIDPDVNNYLTYTIAFQAASAESVLKDCVGEHDDRFFSPVAGELGDTFDSIVASITKLRLTN